MVSPTYCVLERRTVCRRFFFYALFHYNTVIDYVKHFCITFVLFYIRLYLFCGTSAERCTRCFYIIKLREETHAVCCSLISRAAPMGQTERAARAGGRPRGMGGRVGICHDIAQNTSDILCSGRAASIAQNGDFVSGARAAALAEKKAAQRAAVIRPRASVAVGVVAALCRSRANAAAPFAVA